MPPCGLTTITKGPCPGTYPKDSLRARKKPSWSQWLCRCNCVYGHFLWSGGSLLAESSQHSAQHKSGFSVHSRAKSSGGKLGQAFELIEELAHLFQAVQELGRRGGDRRGSGRFWRESSLACCSHTHGCRRRGQFLHEPEAGVLVGGHPVHQSEAKQVVRDVFLRADGMQVGFVPGEGPFRKGEKSCHGRRA